MTDAEAQIDMSLRLWSDEIVLGPVLQALGLEGRVHVRGEPTRLRNGATFVPPRHYACVAGRRGRDGGDVETWMRPLLAQIRGDRQLPALLAARRVEATLWVAMLGDETRPVPTPDLDARLVAAAGALGLVIFLENYTELVDGNASRRWLPEDAGPTGNPTSK